LQRLLLWPAPPFGRFYFRADIEIAVDPPVSRLSARIRQGAAAIVFDRAYLKISIERGRRDRMPISRAIKKVQDCSGEAAFGKRNAALGINDPVQLHHTILVHALITTVLRIENSELIRKGNHAAP
jgi:hypothetical protein